MRTYANSNGAAFTALFRGERVWVAQVRAPVASTDGQDAELRDDDGSANGGGYFFRCLDAQTDVTL